MRIALLESGGKKLELKILDLRSPLSIVENLNSAFLSVFFVEKTDVFGQPNPTSPA